MPKVSIIIPSWNTAKITYKCVQTIIKHLPADFYEVIIVDNGSTDNTVNLFKKLITQKNGKRLIFIQNKTNLGFSKASNIGAARASGKFLFFLNSDMELIDDSVVGMISYLSSNPKTGVIGPKMLNPDLSPQASVFPPQTAKNAFKEFWLKQKSAYSKYIPNTTDASSVWAISGGALAISTALFQTIGGWDERYYFYYEDLELCRQVNRHGYKISYYPICKLIHRHGASGHHIADNSNQWRRLIPSAKIYFGFAKYLQIQSIIWLSQKWRRFFAK